MRVSRIEDLERSLCQAHLVALAALEAAKTGPGNRKKLQSKLSKHANKVIANWKAIVQVAKTSVDAPHTDWVMTALDQVNLTRLEETISCVIAKFKIPNGSVNELFVELSLMHGSPELQACFEKAVPYRGRENPVTVEQKWEETVFRTIHGLDGYRHPNQYGKLMCIKKGMEDSFKVTVVRHLWLNPDAILERGTTSGPGNSESPAAAAPMPADGAEPSPKPAPSTQKSARAVRAQSEAASETPLGDRNTTTNVDDEFNFDSDADSFSDFWPDMTSNPVPVVPGGDSVTMGRVLIPKDPIVEAFVGQCQGYDGSRPQHRSGFVGQQFADDCKQQSSPGATFWKSSNDHIDEENNGFGGNSGTQYQRYNAFSSAEERYAKADPKMNNRFYEREIDRFSDMLEANKVKDTPFSSLQFNCMMSHNSLVALCRRSMTLPSAFALLDSTQRAMTLVA